MKKGVIILGIHDGHNAGAALTKNGKVLAAINEERLNNIKNYSGVPLLSIRKVFEISNVSLHEIDLIAIASFLSVEDPVKQEKNIIQPQVVLAG